MAMLNHASACPGFSDRVEVGDNGRGDGAVGGLANADEAAGEQENKKGRRKAGGPAGKRPEQHADTDEHTAGITVGQMPKDGARRPVTVINAMGQKAHEGQFGLEVQVRLLQAWTELYEVRAGAGVFAAQEGLLDVCTTAASNVAVDIIERG